MEISTNLNQFLLGKTAIVITHRILSGMQFDKVVVLEQGQIIEQGSPAQLLQMNGAYASIWKRQQEKEASEEGV
jgi:ATP-binding cassette subfamily B protein